MENGKYKAKYFEIKSTEFGDRVHVYIDDFYIILPERFNKKINQQSHIEQLNKMNLNLVFNGKDKQCYNFLQLSFEECANDEKTDKDKSDEDDEENEDEESDNNDDDGSDTDVVQDQAVQDGPPQKKFKAN